MLLAVEQVVGGGRHMFIMWGPACDGEIKLRLIRPTPDKQGSVVLQCPDVVSKQSVKMYKNYVKLCKIMSNCVKIMSKSVKIM